MKHKVQFLHFGIARSVAWTTQNGPIGLKTPTARRELNSDTNYTINGI